MLEEKRKYPGCNKPLFAHQLHTQLVGAEISDLHPRKKSGEKKANAYDDEGVCKHKRMQR